ncbi:MAG: coiled-coil domain-containing protein, partial [Planctomycetota bacterium]
MPPVRHIAAVASALLLGVLAGTANAQGQREEPLTRDQSLVRERMLGLEQRLLEMARLSEAERPERAAQLRRALALSREQFVATRMATVRDLLQQGDYAEAARLQADIIEDLGRLADALREEQWGNELTRLRKAASGLEALRQRQRQLAAGAESLSGQTAFRTAEGAQGELAEAARRLLVELQSGPGSDQLAAAITQMSAARGALARMEGREAGEAQRAAARGLAEALEAVRRAIDRLEARRREAFRTELHRIIAEMLETQRELSAGTMELNGPGDGEDRPSRAVRLRAARLAAGQEDVAESAAQARSLVAEEGSTVAFPVALAQVEGDARVAAEFLRTGIAGAEVRELQGEIEATLQALLDALGGEALRIPTPQERPEPKPERRRQRGLVEVGAELKVARAVQAALKRRTARVDALRGEGREAPWVEAEVDRLTDRQASVTDMLTALTNAL